MRKLLFRYTATVFVVGFVVGIVTAVHFPA